VIPEGNGTLSLTGVTQEQVGDLAFAERVPLHELTTRTATLEEAFLEVTAGEQEFGTTGGLG
jgi:ABC-2 type transport system ATP-binding protein